MTKFHQDLCEHSQWYKKWHDNSTHAFIHWLILVLFAVAISTSISNLINTQSAQAVDNQSAFQLETSPNSTSFLTTKLLQSVKKYLKASGSARIVALNEMTAVAIERQSAMVKRAKNNPKDIWIDALPESLLKQMPDEIVALLEYEVGVDGVMTVFHVDYPAGHKVEDEVFILEENGTGKKYNLHFDTRSPYLRTGDKVKVRGLAVRDELVLALGRNPSNLQVTDTQALTSGQEKTLAILVNFTDNTSQPFTSADVVNKMFNNPDSMSAYYGENSFGVSSFVGNAVGWYTIPYSSGTCSYNTFATAAKNAAQAAGVSLSGYNHFVYFFPGISACGWAGLSNVGGNPSNSWINGYNDSYVISHELGHAIGMYHASSLNCGSQQIDDSCTLSEYGDPYDDMGASWIHRHLSAAHKYQLGWGKVQTVTSSGIYTIYPQETANTNTQILKIAKPNSGEAYYIEYRQPIGFDTSLPSNMTNVSVHVFGGAQSQRLDMSPDGNFNDSSLYDGASFVDNANGITITQISHSAVSAVVQVTMNGQTCNKSAPNVNLLPVSQSGSSGQALNYSVSVKNNDNSACGITSFNLSSVVPAGFNSSFNLPTLNISPGSTVSTGLVMTSGAGILDGSYNFTVSAADSSDSNHQSSTTGSYILFTPVPDTTPPIVSVTNPTNGAKITAANIIISVSATDNVKVTKVEISVDNILQVSDVSSPYSHKWNTKKISSGAHTISAKAFDAAGNSSVSSIQITK